MKGPYQEVVFTDFSGGLATKVEDNKIDDNQSPDLQNITYDGGGSFMPRRGDDIFGAATSASGSIKATWVTANDLDTEIPLRMADDGTNAFLEYYNPQTTAWENLDAGYTTGLDWGHAYYDYYTYYCSKKDSQRRFNGAVWSTSTYADSAYSRVDLSVSAASAVGFLSAGSVVLDGEEVYYSSYSGTALSGITFTAAHDGGKAIAQLPTSAGEVPAPDGGWTSASSGLPKGDIMFENDAQLFVAGASAVSGNIVYYTAVDEPTNYTISATPGGGGTARFPEAVGSITGLNNFDEVLTVLKENTIRQLTFTEIADGGAGTLEIVARNEVLTGAKVGAINNKSVAKVENNLFYASPSGWINGMATTNAGRKITEVSRVIRPTVEGYDFSRSASIYFDGKYYVACGTSGSDVNNIVLVYDNDFKAWTRFVGWNVNDWFIYASSLYYGASNEMKTYKALTGFDDNGSAYETFWTSKQMDFAIPSEQKRMDQVYVEGFMTTNTTIGVSAYFDGDTESPVAKSIVGTGDYVSTTDDITVIGGVVWGTGIYGGGSGDEAYNLRRFRVTLRYGRKPFYNMQLKIGTASPGFVYKITHIAPYIWQVPGKRAPTNSLI